MYHSSKYFTIMTGEPSIEYPPKLYIDFYKIKASKRRLVFCDTIMIMFGIFNFQLLVEFKRNYIEV